MECDLDRTGLASWREVVPHRTDVLLEDVEVFDDWLVLTERFDGLSHLKIDRSSSIRCGPTAWAATATTGPPRRTWTRWRRRACA